MSLNDVTVGNPHASAHNEERRAINELQPKANGAVRFDTLQGALTETQKANARANIGLTIKDTGLKDMTTLVAANLDPSNVGKLYLQRQNERVKCVFVNLKILPGPGVLHLTTQIPNGYKATYRKVDQVTRNAAISSLSLMIAWGTYLSWYGETFWTGAAPTTSRNRPTEGITGEMTWSTTDAFPTA